MSAQKSTRSDPGHNPSFPGPHARPGLAGQPAEATDHEAALVVAGLLAGRQIADEDLGRLPTKPADWHGLACCLKPCVVERRQERLGDYFANLGRLHPETAAAMQQALALIELPPEEESSAADQPRRFVLEVLDTETFLAQDYPIEWFIEGIMVKHKNCIIGGPVESLKTSLLVDMVISCATMTPFLDKFPVPRPIRTLIITGESGPPAVQNQTKRIMLDRGLIHSVDELPLWLDEVTPERRGLYWSFQAPKLADPEQLDAVIEFIERNQIELVMLDPMYLMLGGGQRAIDPKAMFAMGELLSDINTRINAAGAMMVAAHHSVKDRGNPYGRPTLEDLSYSGFTQFARQWIMIKRECAYDGSGVHKLNLISGGSSNHSNDFELYSSRLENEVSSERLSFLVGWLGAAL